MPLVLTVGSVAPASAAAAGSGTTLSVGARPSSVPASYVATPQGYFDPHCIYEVAADQVLAPSGKGMALVTVPAAARPAPSNRAKASFTLTARQIAAGRQIPACPSPHYDLHGKPAPNNSASAVPDGSASPTVNGWVEDAGKHLGAMSYLHAQWNVPAAPTNQSTQTVYFFPGLQNLTGTTIIMQPVLAWNQGGSGIAHWSGASWNCCSVGNNYHSAYIHVTGSTVSGDVGGSGCSTSTNVCSNWQIVTYDWGSQASTTFNTTPGGRVMNDTYGGVLEAYGVSGCGMYPGNSVTFSAFYLDDITGAHIATPSWRHDQVAAGTTPACNYNVGGTTNVNLSY